MVKIKSLEILSVGGRIYRNINGKAKGKQESPESIGHGVDVWYIRWVFKRAERDGYLQGRLEDIQNMDALFQKELGWG